MRSGCIADLFDVDISPVYDVSARQTFEELTRWFHELETYTSKEVVKIVVGNKVC